MKRLNQVSLRIVPVCAALITLQCLAHATPSLPKSSHLTLAKSVTLPMSYSLNLSLAGDSSGSSAVPSVTLNLANATQYILAFRWDSPRNVVFGVDYKSAIGNPELHTGWKRLTPNIQPSLKDGSADAGLLYSGISYSVVFQILPGQQNHGLSFQPDFPMSKQGYYRITATITIPVASEFDGPADHLTRLRSFELVLHSEPLVIKHTADGFAPVRTSLGSQH